EDINITATTVRLPIVSGHSESINIETKFPINIKELRELFSNSKGIKILDNPKDNLYPMPINSTDRDEVFIGRIRKDNSIDNGVNLWVVSDNLRKGAALNAVQISETLIDQNLL
ncbi:MAG TPA: Asd/ArgC dimerization domain-containing protein, partial [Tissierellaceae bacterium]|nr:Asd/ArgC dimerization domain-containing protein [Tissierellaceae bacterium]